MRNAWLSLAAALVVGAAQLASAAEEPAPTGYSDTPLLPGTRWHVHDGNRPHPAIVTPGSFSSDEQPGKPPSDAIVLFDGKTLDAWQTEKAGPARWKVQNGYMEVLAGSGDIYTKQKFRDYQLHVEFREPSPAEGHSQERGNSGVFLAGLYEVQVLEASFRAGGRNMTVRHGSRIDETGYPQVCNFDDDPDLYFNCGPEPKTE